MAPSAMNRQTWTFVVVQNQEKIQKLAAAVGKAMGRAEGYNFYLPNAVVICANDMNANPMGVQDCACAMQNIFLAANALGIGSVWLGTWPQTARVQAQAELFGLPDTQKPHSIIALGYPKEKSTKEKLIWEEGRVHYEKW
jgi:nitroreductase